MDEAMQLLVECGIEMSPVHEVEVELLVTAGVSVPDFEYALDRWGSASRVKDDWPFIRTVALSRRAEVIAIQRGLVT
ncbi:hypothetical protein AS850_02875 [Frondihabitans sp. 762G35]|uniref:hypothetical protein n=1 Tax=Frondihabitans sp. 762G35 TaxID=1446794 RepID=UPI000D222F6C|nr:hypothetical protein [Frondihabitans sp. 762G35]ARC56016.1 hypothetical protein AS850_02875 [Frondihabitans sp. 762G35]